MKNINIRQKLIFGLLFTLVFFIGVEVTLRIVGIAEGQQYAPPRLIKVVNDGKLEGGIHSKQCALFSKKMDISSPTHNMPVEMVLAFQHLER